MTQALNIVSTSSLVWDEKIARSLGYRIPTDPEYGAIGNGIADDTAALQACIDSVNHPVTPTGTSAVTVWLGDGVYRITDTLKVYRRAVRFLGVGVGNTADHGVSMSTTLRWGGPAGKAMLEIRDARQCVVSDIYFQGNTAAPPLAGVNLKWLAGDSHGSNEFNAIDRCLFGFFPWRGGNGQGSEMDYGILIDGDNGNNDSFFFRECVIARATIAGIKIANTQSVWGQLTNCTIGGDAVGGNSKGLVTSSNITLNNTVFNACSVDIEANSTAAVEAFGMSSEYNSGAIIHCTGGGSRVNVYGGYWRTEACGEAFIKHDACYDKGGISIRGIKLFNDGTKKLKITGYAGGAMGYLTVENCNLALNAIEVTSGASPSPGIQLSINDTGYHTNVVVKNGQKFFGSNISGDSLANGWGRVVGKYLQPQGTGRIGVQLASGVETAAPVWVAEPMKLDRLGIAVTTAGTAGTVIRLGIRKSLGFRPGALLLDAGTVAGDSLGNVEVTSSQELVPGLYWLTCTAQATGGTLPAVRSLSETVVSASGTSSTLAAALGADPPPGGVTSSAGVSGALPASFTAAGDTYAPLIVGRIA